MTIMDLIEEVRASSMTASESPGPPTQRQLTSPPHPQHLHLAQHTTLPATEPHASTKRFSNINSFRARLRTTFHRLRSRHEKPIRSDPHHESPQAETWQGHITVAYQVQNSDVTRVGVVLFDPQCEDDTISTRFAANFGQNFDDAPRYHYADTVTDHPIVSVGNMEARWSAHNPMSQGPSFAPTFYDADFIVIDSTRFDVIIGRRTINKLHLFTRNNALVAAFRHNIDKVDDATEKAKIRAEELKKAKEARELYEKKLLSAKKAKMGPQ